MKTGTSRRTLVAAAAAGLAVGLLWRLVYRGAVPPLLLELGHLAAALAVLAGLRLVARRLAEPAPTLGAIILGLLIAPAALAPPYVAGYSWGVRWLAIDLAVIAAAVVVGAVAGRCATAGRLGAVAATTALAAAAAAPLLVARPFLIERPTPPVLGLALDPAPAELPVALIGIDGGDWRIARPLLDAGGMPNLARILAAGQHGVLRSLAPMQSPVVWTSLATGRRPGAHGLTGWHDADTRNLEAAPLWDLLAANGWRTLTVNVPGSWPPQQLAGGAVVAGIPVPNPFIRGRAFNVGSRFRWSSIADELARAEPVERLDADRYRFELLLPDLARRRSPGRPAHVLVEVALNRIEPRQGRRTRVDARRTAAGVELDGPALPHPALLPGDGTPRWFDLRDGAVEMLVLGAVLRAADDTLELWLSRPEQVPWAPEIPFAAGVPPELLADRTDPYVVEGVGWVLVDDRRLAAVLADAQLAAERRRARLVLEAIERLDPRLTIYVITVTDRLQHAFLDFHPTAGVAPAAPLKVLDGRDPVVESYLLADRLLGEIVAALPPEAIIFVASDHGMREHQVRGESGHRVEGMWAARGPMIPHLAAPHELSLVDVVPTLMRCLGGPLAADLDGVAYRGLCPEVVEPPPVAGYSAATADAPTQLIDRSREEQLRSLGYIEGR